MSLFCAVLFCFVISHALFVVTLVVFVLVFLSFSVPMLYKVETSNKNKTKKKKKTEKEEEKYKMRNSVVLHKQCTNVKISFFLPSLPLPLFDSLLCSDC